MKIKNEETLEEIITDPYPGNMGCICQGYTNCTHTKNNVVVGENKEALNLQRFIDRIGKRIYRSKTSCDCRTCEDVYIHGVVVADEAHAKYLYDVYCDERIVYYDTCKTFFI